MWKDNCIFQPNRLQLKALLQKRRSWLDSQLSAGLLLAGKSRVACKQFDSSSPYYKCGVHYSRIQIHISPLFAPLVTGKKVK